MITAIIFDCFGMLSADLWKEFCSTLAPDVRKQASDLNHALDSGMITQAEFMEHIQELTSKEAQLVENARNGGDSKNTTLLHYIAELKKDYKIGMLSNISSSWITDKLLTPEEQALFDDMVLSYKVGTTKPDPQIFEIACNNLGVEPNQTIFVDDIDSYVAAAQALGIQGVVYHDFPQAKADIETILANSNS